MNKFFKSIWSDALGAWVATSEKSPARGKRSGRVARGVAAVVLMAAAGGGAAAAINQGNNSSTTGPSDIALGDNASTNGTATGIYIGEQQFIHAPKTGAFIRIESMRSTYWRSRYYGARRIA